MSTTNFDIVVFGATGFTGRLITRYLASHPQFTQGLFSFAIAARSQSKLHTLVQDLKLPSRINTIQVDVTDFKSVEAVVRRARVVINTVGPYWRWGTPVVKACARNGVHYVDLTGESVWIKEIINQFDYLATKTGAIIVPSCGYDSIPSDVSAYLSNKTLKSHGDYDVATSISGQKVRGGISGGTLSTVFTLLEDVPRDKLRDSAREHSLSPGETPAPGAFFLMAPANKKLVQRTFGLLELQRIEASQLGLPAEVAKITRRESYGPSFAYDEFLILPSRFSAIAFSTMFPVSTSPTNLFVTQLRWLLKKFLPAPGSGPSEESMEKGFFEIVNHTTSTSTPSVHVKSVFKGDRDPGYALTAIMISESALSLLLPPVSKPPPPFKTSSLPEGLPALAKKGGVLTPMTAFGDVLITRLIDTERFSYESHVVGQASSSESRKDV
ncbi:hypothetical protein C0995_002507 [Termitomyces sp. Mi166|nr:hypothetical protein C0995_002507 [Termitomyces sp. Mi166\